MDIKRIAQLLEGITTRVTGIKNILIVTDDGFPIFSTLEAGEEELRATAVGAIISEAGQRGIRELALGDIELNIAIGTYGYFVMKRLLPGTILLVIVDSNDKDSSPLGLVLLRVRLSVPELLKAMSDDPPASQTMNA
jgi:predicted regulator of Ras-like GTPase activity (Roadblock/LC7/MglB family)